MSHFLKNIIFQKSTFAYARMYETMDDDHFCLTSPGPEGFAIFSDRLESLVRK